MSTIFDVAREAGVSKSTVSRVLNHEMSVKEETRIAVEEAILKLDYSPSYFAQGIRTGRTNTIAMLVPEYTNVFYGKMFTGIEDIALKYGYMVLVCNTERHTTAEIEYIEELLKRKVDGIIYNTYNMNDNMLRYLKKISQNTPVVFMDETIKKHSELPAVYTDGYKSTRDAVHYLYEHGKRNIGYVRNIASISVTEYRYQGFLQGLKDCGLESDPSLIYQAGPEADADYIAAGVKAARHFCNLKKMPDAIITAIDLLAIGCVKQFVKEGIKVPESVNVIGYDNISLGELIEPPLTTISQATREMGQKAAEMLIEIIEKEKKPEQIVFAGTLIQRNTTD